MTLSPFATSHFPFVAGTLSAHCNPVTCVLAGLDGPLTVRSGAERIEADMLLIRPGVEHEVDINGRARVIYFDGLTFPGAARLATRVPRGLASLASDALEGTRPELQLELRERLSHRRGGLSSDVARVITDITAEPMLRMDQGALARRLGLSRTHAMRMFKAVTGMTFRGFKQWTALCAAARHIAEGELVRTAAMDAGFSDTAHLTRTFRHWFGITPSLATADRRAGR